jgi:hypothetical protein
MPYAKAETLSACPVRRTQRCAHTYLDGLDDQFDHENLPGDEAEKDGPACELTEKPRLPI